MSASSGRRAPDPAAEPRTAPARAWRFPLTSLRTKLQLFALVLVLVPTVLFALLVLARVRVTLEHALGRQLAEVAHDVREQLTATMRDERQNVRTWARQEAMRDVVTGDADRRIARFLASLAEDGAPYLEIVCVARDGRVLAASDARAVGSRRGDEEWARRALAGEEWTGPVVATPEGGRTVDLAAPVRDPERPDVVVGALLARYDWRRALAITARIRRTLVPHGLGVDVVLLDADGASVGESWRDDLDAAEREQLRTAAATAARHLPETRRGYVSDADASVLIGYERPPEREVAHGWQALVIEPQAEAFAPVRAIEQQLAIVLALLLVAALVIATLLANRMSRPLRELTEATRELTRAGGPRRSVEARSRDEIGELAAAFNRMTAELARAQHDLLVAAQFAFAGEVAAGVAHEVRTPLGILRSSAQMLGRSLAGADAETLELLHMMVEEVDRIDRVIDGLIEIARPHRPSIEPTHLAPVLARALDFVDGQARAKGVTVRRALAGAPDLARCDAEEMYRVALNLIVNALQMVPAGGEITVRLLPRHDGRVGFEVADNGPGIPAAARAHVFTPFFTLRQGGTGLGLALVQRVVQAHQGLVTLASDVGVGATFRVELPAAEEA